NSGKIAARFVASHIVPRLDRCRAMALEELSRLEQDRRAVPFNSSLRFFNERRSHQQGRMFDPVMRAHHQAEEGKAKGLDVTTYAQRAGLHIQEELTAQTYLDAIWTHYLVSP